MLQCTQITFNMIETILANSYVTMYTVIHQVAQAGFPEEPPKNEQAVLIHAEFSDSTSPEKAPFPAFPLL